MGLELGTTKLAIWDHFRTKTHGRQKLLIDACGAVEMAFATSDAVHYPFKAAHEVNKPYLRHAAAKASRQPCHDVDLFSIVNLMEGAGGGRLDIGGLHDLVQALEKPLLKKAFLKNHRSKLDAFGSSGGHQHVLDLARLALTAHMNPDNGKPKFIMEYMIESVALFLLCGAIGYRAGFDDMLPFIRGMSEGLLLGEYAHHRPAPRGTCVAIVL